MVGPLPAPKCKPSSATTETGSLVGHSELAVRSMARVDNIPHNISSKTAGHRGERYSESEYCLFSLQIHRYNNLLYKII